MYFFDKMLEEGAKAALGKAWDSVKYKVFMSHKIAIYDSTIQFHFVADSGIIDVIRFTATLENHSAIHVSIRTLHIFNDRYNFRAVKRGYETYKDLRYGFVIQDPIKLKSYEQGNESDQSLFPIHLEPSKAQRIVAYFSVGKDNAFMNYLHIMRDRMQKRIESERKSTVKSGGLASSEAYHYIIQKREREKFPLWLYLRVGENEMEKKINVQFEKANAFAKLYELERSISM
ncbi:hypothetical protein AGMMS49992_03000 [Clostridia bacterium]|nr:hypothetical protein AGMMS49992_03000 [Clostridia bacterium]